MTHAFTERWLAAGRLQVRFVKPVFVADRITARGIVLNEAKNTCAVWCENQLGLQVISDHTMA